jgi:hypothetical protein
MGYRLDARGAPFLNRDCEGVAGSSKAGLFGEMALHIEKAFGVKMRMQSAFRYCEDAQPREGNRSAGTSLLVENAANPRNGSSVDSQQERMLHSC